MNNPTETKRKLADMIIKEEIKVVEFVGQLKGSTIKDVVSFTSQDGIPALIFVTEDNKVFVDASYRNDFDDEWDEFNYLRSVFGKSRLLNEIIYKRIDSGDLIRAGIIDKEAFNNYENYVREEEKKQREEYAKELEYKNYLELKEKFEGERMIWLMTLIFQFHWTHVKLLLILNRTQMKRIASY